VSVLPGDTAWKLGSPEVSLAPTIRQLLILSVAAINLRKESRRTLSSRAFKPPEHRGFPSLSQVYGLNENDERTPLLGGERFEALSPSTWPATGLRIVNSTGYATVSIVVVPFAICAGAASWQPVTCFVLNLLCIPGLRSVLSFLLEELSSKLGQTLGGLLNTVGEGVLDLIVGILQLFTNDL
jgi:hypothetical protein